MLVEESYSRPGLGVLNLIGDSETGSLLVEEVEWGEFVDLSGIVHPLSKTCVLMLLQTDLCCELHALELIRLTGELNA